VQLHPNSTARIKEFEFDFGTLEIKGRGASGNILTKYPVRKIDLVEKGQSSIGGVKIWFDEKFGRLVNEEKDKTTYLGDFNTGDQVLVAYKDGNVELTNFELTNKYEPDEIISVTKFDPEGVYSAVYFDGNNKEFFVKRFKVEMKTEKLKSSIISEHAKSVLHVFSGNEEVNVKYNIVQGGGKGKDKVKVEETAKLNDMIDVKGWKALGNRLTQFDVSGKISEVLPKEKPAPKASKEVKMGTTIELEVNPKASKKGSQGDLF
jgi:topoisomerase-4 subunit A